MQEVNAKADTNVKAKIILFKSFITKCLGFIMPPNYESFFKNVVFSDLFFVFNANCYFDAKTDNTTNIIKSC